MRNRGEENKREGGRITLSEKIRVLLYEERRQKEREKKGRRVHRVPTPFGGKEREKSSIWLPLFLSSLRGGRKEEERRGKGAIRPPKKGKRGKEGEREDVGYPLNTHPVAIGRKRGRKRVSHSEKKENALGRAGLIPKRSSLKPMLQRKREKEKKGERKRNQRPEKEKRKRSAKPITSVQCAREKRKEEREGEKRSTRRLGEKKKKKK